MSPWPIKLKRLLMDDPVNMQEVKSVIIDISRLHGEMHVAMIKIMVGTAKRSLRPNNDPASKPCIIGAEA
jgi:hypothetical protein